MATYDYLKSKNGHKIQVESAKRDGAGKNIENTYAKQNGYYSQLTAGLADNMTPYSEDSGDFQENPFISNGTGTNNNQEIVTVGDYALVKEKQGNTVCVNQLVKNGNFADNSEWRATSQGSLSITNNIATFSTTDYTSARMFQPNFTTIAGHKYLVIGNIKADVNGTLVIEVSRGWTKAQETAIVDTYVHIQKIISPSEASDTYTRLNIYMNPSNNLNYTLEVKNIQLIDLTQWFGATANIPQDLLDYPEHWSLYQNYGNYIAYNTGTLVNADGVKLVSTGRNLFNENIESNALDGDGEEISGGQSCRSADYIEVIPNLTYNFYTIQTLASGDYWRLCEYDKDKNFISAYTNSNSVFTRQLQANTRYIRFMIRKGGSNWGTTPPTKEQLQVTISLYYTPEQGGEGYDKYYPYEEPTIVDTGVEVLRQAGSVKDYKTKDGIIHGIVGSFNGTQMTFVRLTEQGLNLYHMQTTGTNLAKPISENIENSFGIPNVMSFNSSTETNEVIQRASNTSDFYILLKTDRTIADFIVQYELAQETTEQGTPFGETLPINDYGMLYWLDENDNLIGIPQGAKIFFPVNYKGFVDDVYSRTSGDAENLVVQSELQESETERDTVDGQLKDAIGGTLRQCLCVKASLDFENTDFVNLGDLTYTREPAGSGKYVFTTTVSNIKQHTNGSTIPNIICSAYQSDTMSNMWNTSNEKTISQQTNTQKIAIHDSLLESGDATAFKAAMKGVLLAYEKA